MRGGPNYSSLARSPISTLTAVVHCSWLPPTAAGPNPARRVIYPHSVGHHPWSLLRREWLLPPVEDADAHPLAIIAAAIASLTQGQGPSIVKTCSPTLMA